jgi:predicted transcriptional regulator
MNPMPEKLRLTITLSDLAARRITAWAKAHDKPRTAWAAQIIETQIEANLDLIDKLVADCALAQGVSSEELLKQWNQSPDNE